MKDKTDKQTVDAFATNWGGARPGAGRIKKSEPSKVVRVPLSKLAAVQAILDAPDERGAFEFNCDLEHGWRLGADEWDVNTSARVSATAGRWVSVVIQKRLARASDAPLSEDEARAALDFVRVSSGLPDKPGLALDTWNKIFGGA
ncbi:MAG: hypothetical protein NHG36_04220 [Chromatiaceae bacterium]|nr:hypothetical protein [Candidatus Thioaporhodococcus sediminis]